MNRQNYSTRRSTQRSKKKLVQTGQYNLFGGVEGVKELIDPKPKVLEQFGIRVVGIVIPESKISIPGYIPEALKQARELVPEVQTTGKPPWFSAKWQTQRRKRRAL